jgi:hypothetical protein
VEALITITELSVLVGVALFQQRTSMSNALMVAAIGLVAAKFSYKSSKE